MDSVSHTRPVAAPPRPARGRAPLRSPRGTGWGRRPRRHAPTAQASVRADAAAPADGAVFARRASASAASTSARVSANGAPGMIAYLDCYSGISGDMTLGALIDAGLPLDELKEAVGHLP